MGRRPKPLLPWAGSRAAARVFLGREYAARRDDLPDGLRETATTAPLQAIIDLDALTTIEPSCGYGRD